MSMNLLLHALDNRNPPSFFVSATPSIKEAIPFGNNSGFTDGYIYAIRNIRGIDVNKKLGIDSPHAREREIAFPGGIDSPDILGATPVNEDDTYKGYSIPNWKKK